MKPGFVKLYKLSMVYIPNKKCYDHVEEKRLPENNFSKQ